jgi:hypothetical protein
VSLSGGGSDAALLLPLLLLVLLRLAATDGEVDAMFVICGYLADYGIAGMTKRSSFWMLLLWLLD